MLRKMKMIRLFLISILPGFVFANPMVGALMTVNDYFRGTAGERMIFYSDESAGQSIQISLDSRYYDFRYGWREGGDTFNFKRYSRHIDIFSFGCQMSDRFQLEIRVPYVRLNYKHPIEKDDYSNAGLSDISINGTYRIFYIPEKYSSFFLTGLKIPTGYYKRDLKDLKLNLGTGSYDIPIALRNDFSNSGLDLFLDIGYIFIGKCDGVSFWQNEKMDIGDEIFSDFVFSGNVYKSIFVKFEMNWFKVFNPDDNVPNTIVYPEQSKLSVTPSIIWKSRNDKIFIEIGCLFDVWGRNTFGGISPVIKIQI